MKSLWVNISKQVQWIVAILGVLAVLQLLVGTLLVLNRGEVVATLGLNNPSFSPEQIAQITDSTVYGGLVVHLIVAVVYILLAFMIIRGKNWARRVTTVVFIIGTIAGITFATSSGALLPGEQLYIVLEQVISLILRLAALWLLWFSPIVRTHFATSGIRALQS